MTIEKRCSKQQIKKWLHPDLRDHVQRWPEDDGMVMVHHPYVIFWCQNQEDCLTANKMYEATKAAVEEARAEKDWMSYIVRQNRGYWMMAFAEIRYWVRDEDYWSLLRIVYQGIEDCWQYRAWFPEFLRAKRPHPETIMEEAEREALAKLPDQLTLYRGYDRRGGDKGWNWCLSREVAGCFAVRSMQGTPMVATAKAKKSDVIAFFDCGGHETIVVDPAEVRIVSKETLSSERTAGTGR